MEDLDRHYERKTLLDVVEQMKDPDETARKQNRVRRALSAFGYLGLLAAFIMALNDAAHPFASAFLAGLAGCATGLAIFLQFAHKQWPVTRKHINMESVKKRLDELEV